MNGFPGVPKNDGENPTPPLLTSDNCCICLSRPVNIQVSENIIKETIIDISIPATTNFICDSVFLFKTIPVIKPSINDAMQISEYGSTSIKYEKDTNAAVRNIIDKNTKVANSHLFSAMMSRTSESL